MLLSTLQDHIQFDNVAYLIFRVTLLELISAQLNEEGSRNCGVPPTVAHFLAGSFQTGCGAVLTLATGSISSNEVWSVRKASSGPCTIVCIVVFFAFPGGSLQVLDLSFCVWTCLPVAIPLQVLQEALTVISLLDVLCEMTSDFRQFIFLQDYPNLLETTVGKWRDSRFETRILLWIWKRNTCWADIADTYTFSLECYDHILI